MATLAALLAIAAVASYASDRATRRQLVDQAGAALAASARGPVIEDLRREADPQRARLVLARALVSDAMEPGSSDRPIDLELAQRLAAEAEAALPSAWEAPMLRGAATYLLWSRERDERLILEAESWQQPLLESLARAPGKSDASRFLAAAYLELWPALSPDRRRQAREHVRRALRDPATFYRLVRPWLERAGSRRAAFAVIPDAPFAWSEIRDIYAQRSDWRAWIQAHEAWTRALQTELEDQLAEADQRLRGGDLRGARELYFKIAHGAPATATGSGLIDEALSRSPPAVADRIYAAGLRRQLDRELGLALIGRPTLAPAVTARLVQAVGEIEPATAALAAVVVGDLPQARLLERRSAEDLWHESWSPYLVAKSLALLSRGEIGEADGALSQVHPSWQARLPYWRARLELARARRDEAAEELARARLERFARLRVPADAWRREGIVSLVDLLPKQRATAFELGFVQVPPAGVVVEIRVDGRIAATRALRSGGRIEVAADLDGGNPHLVEVEPLTGGTVAPGELQLLPADP